MDYSRQTKNRLIIGGLLLLFIVGDGLIYLIYGQNAAVAGLFCLAAGLVPAVLIILVIELMDWIVKHVRNK